MAGTDLYIFPALFPLSKQSTHSRIHEETDLITKYVFSLSIVAALSCFWILAFKKDIGDYLSNYVQKGTELEMTRKRNGQTSQTYAFK